MPSSVQVSVYGGESNVAGRIIAMYENLQKQIRPENFSYKGHAKAVSETTHTMEALEIVEVIRLTNKDDHVYFGRLKDSCDNWVVLIWDEISDGFCRYGRSSTYVHDIIP